MKLCVNRLHNILPAYWAPLRQGQSPNRGRSPSVTRANRRGEATASHQAAKPWHYLSSGNQMAILENRNRRKVNTMQAKRVNTQEWPSLPLEEWKDTCATLHMWTQIVGKIRLAQTPLVNHWWNVPLYVSARGLTTTAMPYRDRIFEIEFDFIDHKLLIECSDGASKTLSLHPQSVAALFPDVIAALGE